MKKKAAIARGVASVMAVTMFTSVSASVLMFDNAGVINQALNLSTSKIVELGDGEATNTVYYDNPYGTDTSDRQATMNMELAVAAENISQAEEGAVLLKNENAALPITTGQRITIFGNGSYNSVDSASNAVNSTSFDAIPAVGLVDSLQTALGADNVNTALSSVYTPMSLTTNKEVSEAPIDQIKAQESSWQSDYNDVAVVTFTRAGSEGNDSALTTAEDRNYLGLSKNEEDLLSYLQSQKQAGVFSKIVAVINSDQAMELGWVDEYDVDACLLSGLPGAVGWTGIANVMTGKVSPSGHTVDTYAANSLSSPAITYAAGNAMDWTNKDWLLANATDNDGNGTNILHYTIYAEGIYIGYKYYETRYEDTVMGTGNADGAAGASVGNAWAYSNEVVYPFGYGLSYTTFDQTLEGVTFDADSDMYQVSVRVKNTGSVAGKSVVEVYAQTPYGSYEQENQVEKASIQLVGFEKTAMLQPGEEATVTVPVERYFLASYDSKGAAGYILSAGDYYLAVGDDAHDALNNVLAAKGYTAADGMTADGNAAKVYSWNQAELDTTTYKMSRVDDTVEVTNQFDHADLNNYGIEMTYLSRSDWQNTYPVERMALAMNDALLEDLNLDWYEKPADAPEVSDFTQGADNGLTFSDMRLIPWEDEDTWNKFIDQLTVDEMTSLLMDSRGSNPIESIAMPAAGRTDDNSGFGPLISEGTNGIKWVTEPITARTWNKELFESRGRVMGIEATFCGLTEIWYGGGNIHRTPVGGRNWQYYSEDGNFGYIIGTYEAKGMQAQGVIYCPKHFVLNDQETFREGISTFANEQSIREIYMRAFEGALCEGGAMGVMTSFNRLGTRFSSANYNLVHNVLKGEWAFKGHTTTDGYTQSGFKMHFEEEAAAGIDYTCASNSDYGDAVKSYIEAGDGYMLECLRNITKHNLYALSRTFIQNGLSSNTAIVTVVPWWETTLLAVTAVSAVVLMICVILMAVWNHEKKQPKKKEA